MYIKVRVTPGSRKEVVERLSANTFAIAVREPAERNLANNRVRALVAHALSVSPSNVRLVTGHRSSVKMFSVELLDNHQ